MSNVGGQSGPSDQLLPGTGKSPTYGTNWDSSTDLSSSVSTITSNPSTDPENKGIKERVWVVARCALTACLASLLAGMTGGFSSPALQDLSNPNISTPAQIFSDTSVLASIFAALGPIGAMFGGLVAWPISDHFGRQAALIVGGVPFLCGWLLIANAVVVTQNQAGFLALLFAGRLLTGFSTGWSIFCASVYIAEISSPKWKGVFGNCNQLFITLGILLMYFLGINFKVYQFHYSNIALVAAVFVALFEILMLSVHETPRWYFSKNMDDNGIKVLGLLRGKEFHIEKEIERIKAGLRRTYSAREQLLEFKYRPVYHPFILIFFLMFFQQFSGINAAVFYASQIFADVGYDTDRANLATFGAVGCVQVVATLMSVVLVDYLGRRKLLVASSIGMITSSFLLGVYFFILEQKCHNKLLSPDCPHHIDYLAIVCVVIFFISFSLGWGPIPWSSMSELLPNHVRTLGGSLCTFVNWGCATIIIFAFKPYSDLVTPKFTWWTFAVIMVISIVFVVMFLPEAKGHSLEEIQEHFETGHVFACSCGPQKSTGPKIPMEETSTFIQTSSVAISRSSTTVN